MLAKRYNRPFGFCRGVGKSFRVVGKKKGLMREDGIREGSGKGRENIRQKF